MTCRCAVLTLLLVSLPGHAAEKPNDFIDILSVAPTVKVAMAYAGPDNFVGTVIDGYLANTCFLQRNAAQALAQAQQHAEALGYRLWLYDCYRPQRAVQHFLRWAKDLSDVKTKPNYYPKLPKDQLVGDYIAEQSGHSRGSTVDLTLASKDRNGNWHPIDMGSAFDLFDPISHAKSNAITAAQAANRTQLEKIMAAAGFQIYPLEWWHFTHQPPVYPDQYFDFPVQ